MGEETKQCFTCKEPKPPDSFNKDKHKKDGLDSSCRPCRLDIRRVNKIKNKDKPCASCGHPKRSPGQTVCRDCNSIKSAMSNYQITRDEVISLRAKDHCDACGRSKDEAATERGFHIDHCHDGGYVRGVLCHYCNTALGLLLDDPIRIEKLKMYINRVNYDESNTIKQ